jgi:hypothetical protein
MRRTFRKLLSLVALGAAVPLLVTPASQAAPAVALAPVTDVLYEMNEPFGSTVMVDSMGTGVNGVINPAGVTTGVVVDGATGYRWPWRNPTAPPASPERVVTVADDPRLDPGSDTYTLEIRFRTHAKFGNIIQKGQARTVGGQVKIQNPKGFPSCLFKGSAGQGATRSPVALNDDQWHTLTCVRTPTAVMLYVDGVLRNRKNGPTGNIDNKFPLAIGGKTECDQITVTCDYFSGDIDYVKISHGS